MFGRVAGVALYKWTKWKKCYQAALPAELKQTFKKLIQFGNYKVPKHWSGEVLEQLSI